MIGISNLVDPASRPRGPEPWVVDHHPVKLIMTSSDDDDPTPAFCSPRQRALISGRSSFRSRQTATGLYDTPLWWRTGGPRWPTGAPNLWASNDRRYASFQRRVACIKISDAFVKERNENGAGSGGAGQLKWLSITGQRAQSSTI